MVDAEAAQAQAQKLADSFAEQGDAEQNGVTEPKLEPEEGGSNKRKLELDEDETGRKKAAPDQSGERRFVPSASGPTKGASGEYTDTIEVAKNMIGKLIGKAGETIRNVQNLTGTRIQIDHNLPGEMKKVTITGASEANITGCLKEIERVMSDEPIAGDQNKTMECPQGIVGRIIGRGGETIRSLQQASMAHIIVDQNFPEGQPRKIVLSGRPDAVERASKMIEELITGDAGNAQTIIQKYSAGINKTIDCPRSIVGRVIGKGGETIKQMQRNFGANIQIDQQQDPMKITIAGPAQAVDAAAQAVKEIINGGNPWLGGPGGPGGFGGPGGPGFGGPRGGPGFAGPGGGFGAGGPGFSAGFPGFGGAGPGFGGGFPGFAGFPGAFPQPFAQPGFGAYGGFGQDPYAAAATPTASSYGAGAGAGASAYAAPAASVWQEMQDEQGRTYYYNTQSGISQWEKPE